MPLYEYRCENCGQLFEVMQKFADAPLTTHEACGGGPVVRLLSAPALQFKGSGWYITDYAKGSGGSSNSKAKNEGSKNEGSKNESSKSSNDKPSTPASSSSSNSSSTTNKS
jgi:putative FmdB family regulatory protein